MLASRTVARATSVSLPEHASLWLPRSTRASRRTTSCVLDTGTVTLSSRRCHPSGCPDNGSVFGERAVRFPDRPTRPTTPSPHGCATRTSLCRTLSPPGCPRDEFVFATTPSTRCPARSVRRVHALAIRSPAPRVCAPRSLRPFARSKSLPCSPSHHPVATDDEFVVCTPRYSVTRTPSRSASAAASHSYLCDGPPRFGSPMHGARSLRSETIACKPGEAEPTSACSESEPSFGCPKFGDAKSIASGSASSAFAAQFPARRTGRFDPASVARGSLEARSPRSFLRDERVAVR